MYNVTSNITTVDMTGRRMAFSEPLYQYDYGQILKITGVELPVSYEVLFSLDGRPTVTVLGDEDGVQIPDIYLMTASLITAYIFLHAGTDDGATELVINIPVKERPFATNEQPTEVQQDLITQTIAALDAGVEAAEAAQSAAEDAAEDAEAWAVGKRGGSDVPSSDPAYQNNAKYYAGDAHDIRDSIQDIKDEAEQAIQAASDAADSARSAASSETNAGADALKAEGYAVGKQNGTDVASGSPYYHNSAKYYKEQADSAASAAAQSKTDAEGQASAAAGSARDASDSATAASGSKSAAAGSATAADGSAKTAEAYAVGKRGGTDVPSSDPAYENNAKYYAGEAANYAAIAQTVVDSNFLLVDHDDSDKKYMVGLYVEDGHFGISLDELVQ